MNDSRAPQPPFFLFPSEGSRHKDPQKYYCVLKVAFLLLLLVLGSHSPLVAWALCQKCSLLLSILFDATKIHYYGMGALNAITQTQKHKKKQTHIHTQLHAKQSSNEYNKKKTNAVTGKLTINNTYTPNGLHIKCMKRQMKIKSNL